MESYRLEKPDKTSLENSQTTTSSLTLSELIHIHSRNSNRFAKEEDEREEEEVRLRT